MPWDERQAIAEKIVDKGANYVLALKDHHPQLAEDAQLWLDTEMSKGRMIVQETIEKNHGCLETRRYGLSTQIEGLTQKPEWAKLKAVGIVKSAREITGKSSTERRYFLCSIDDPERFAKTVRDHWSIETSNIGYWVSNLVKMLIVRAKISQPRIWL